MQTHPMQSHRQGARDGGRAPGRSARAAVSVHQRSTVVSQHEGDAPASAREGGTGLALVCRKGSADSVLFAADVTGWAGGFAGAIGRTLNGTSFPCRLFRLVRGDFRCMNRCDGKLQMTARRRGA